MTEAEWLVCTDPSPMLDYMRSKASDRKLRLFACACCRHVWDWLMDERSRQAIEAAEQYADGLTSDENLNINYNAARAARSIIKRTIPQGGSSPPFCAARAAEKIVETAVESVIAAVGWVTSAVGFQAIPDPANGDFDNAYEAILYFQSFHACPLLQDIFGNPFRPVTLKPAILSWHDGTIPRIAQSIYKERQFPAGTFEPARMSELADALIDAGCDNKELFLHCRSKGPHVRGCWPIDLILGKK
jgi:hypothetical protein